VREARGTVSRADALLRLLAAERQAADRRMAGRALPPETASTNRTDELLQELQVRDEELRASVEELTAQLTELRRASALLERERSKYVDLFVNAPEAYVSTDEDGLINDANLATAKLFSSEPQFLVGKPLISFVARQHTRAFREHLKSLSDHGTEQEPAPVCLRMRPRGQMPFMVSLKASLVRNPSAKPVAIRWNLCRVDPSEAELARALKEEDVVELLARDLRGPLETIVGLAQALLEGKVRGEDDTRQSLAWIERTATSQRAILDELVGAFDARGETDGSASEMLDLNEEVTAAVSNVVHPLEPQRIAIRDFAPAGTALVRSTRGRLRRVVELFLRRALEGSPRSGGPVSVRVSADAGEVVVDIETPQEARVPLGWELRAALAAHIVKQAQGHLVLKEDGPSARLRFPVAG
jgi:PAS domain-containing protein